MVLTELSVKGREEVAFRGTVKKHVGEIKEQHNGITLVGRSVMILRRKAQAKLQNSLH